jgi:hypothetical protein
MSAKQNNTPVVNNPKQIVGVSLPIANPHHCPECSWQCTCDNQPCSCCQGNDIQCHALALTPKPINPHRIPSDLRNAPR